MAEDTASAEKQRDGEGTGEGFATREEEDGPALGLHNTVEEIVEAQRTSHLERLTKSATGRHILEKLGIRYERQTGEKIDVPRWVREKLTIPNLPRHMHPVHHVERRTARAKALRRLLEKEEGVYYTDAARYDRDAMAAAVVDKQGKIVSLAGPEQRRTPPSNHILDYYAGERMRYPPAHPSLDKRQEVAWRRLQTGTYPSPAQLSRWFPDRYKGDCQLCGARATLHHIPLLKKIPNQESWEALLLCTDLKVQEQVVRLAEDAAGVQGILAVA
ncbi:hypothetical protein HPB47_012230 [Ixodes persulcatus]|uniref:Uncharacterized protein n=1 Tax=Ixodes persulcatus TaxID=34615 RepID=A0AC60NU25_IXOPE|nr:hypothetical protein HPB47_012230 [Ixodes persulcatus]